MIKVTEPSNKKAPKVMGDRVVGYLGESCRFSDCKKEEMESYYKNMKKARNKRADLATIVSLVYFVSLLILSQFIDMNFYIILAIGVLFYPSVLSLIDRK